MREISGVAKFFVADDIADPTVYMSIHFNGISICTTDGYKMTRLQDAIALGMKIDAVPKITSSAMLEKAAIKADGPAVQDRGFQKALADTIMSANKETSGDFSVFINEFASRGYNITTAITPNHVAISINSETGLPFTATVNNEIQDS